jgi:hypothetical protein
LNRLTGLVNNPLLQLNHALTFKYFIANVTWNFWMELDL